MFICFDMNSKLFLVLVFKDIFFLYYNIYEIRARGGKVIAFGHGVEPQVRDELFYEYIDLPDLNAELNTLIQLTAGQLFAYYCAVSLNRNIDKPRALAKSVTVR